MGPGMNDVNRCCCLLLQLGEIVTSQLNLDSLFADIIEQTCQVMDTQRASVFLYDSSDQSLWTHSGSNLGPHKVRIPADKGVAGWVFQNRQPVSIPDVRGDERFYGDIDPDFITRDILAVPLFARDGSCMGVLQAINKNNKALDNDDLTLLTSASHYISMALQNSRLVAELQEKQVALDAELTNRTQLSQFFIYLVTLIGFYAFFAAFLKMFPALSAGHRLSQMVSRLLEFSFIGGAIAIILARRKPLSEFGVTLLGWRKAIWESMLCTLPLLLLALFIKQQFLTHTKVFQESTLLSLRYFDASYIVYLLIAPLQEFIARGVYQNMLRRMLVGKRSGLWAILLTSLLFGTFHIHQSISLAALSITMGLLWGWLYTRHRTLLGISLSHFLIGNWVGILGLWDLMAKY